MRAIRKAQHNIITKMRARAYNGSMAYTGYQPLHEREGYSREPVITFPSNSTTKNDENDNGNRRGNDYQGKFVVDKMS